MDIDTEDRVKKLFVLFKTAVEDERRAQKMYAEFLDLLETDGEDQIVRQMVQQILDDEKRHEEVLVERYNRLRTIYDSVD